MPTNFKYKPRVNVPRPTFVPGKLVLDGILSLVDPFVLTNPPEYPLFQIEIDRGYLSPLRVSLGYFKCVEDSAVEHSQGDDLKFKLRKIQQYVKIEGPVGNPPKNLYYLYYWLFNNPTGFPRVEVAQAPDAQLKAPGKKLRDLLDRALAIKEDVEQHIIDASTAQIADWRLQLDNVAKESESQLALADEQENTFKQELDRQILDLKSEIRDALRIAERVEERTP